MSKELQIQQLVRLVADGLRRREAEEQIVKSLTAAGVPGSESPALFAAIKTACQQGVQSVITGGHSSAHGPPDDPLLAEAFRVGQASIRGAVRGVWLRRIMIVVIVASTFGLIFWRLRS